MQNSPEAAKDPLSRAAFLQELEDLHFYTSHSASARGYFYLYSRTAPGPLPQVLDKSTEIQQLFWIRYISDPNTHMD